jgi:peptidoglycan-associated lipoprotein
MNLKLLLFLSLTLLTVFSGCGQKAPEVEPIVVNQGKIANDNLSSKRAVDSVQNSNLMSSDIKKGTGRLEIIYFPFDRFTVSSAELDKVINNAQIMKMPQNLRSSLKVEGNCDEWGTDEYNYALGLKRAKSVKQALIENGVASSRVSIVSYGEAKPSCSEHNDACWQRNRRVDFVLID